MTTGAHAEPARTRSPSTGVTIVLLLAVLAPMVALSLSPWHTNSSLWYFGMLPVLIGLFAGPRVGLSAAVLTPALMGIAFLLRDLPVVGALFLAVIGIATGFSAMRGWHLMLSFAGPLAALALIGDLYVALPTGTVAAGSSAASGWVAVAFILAGGLWTAVLGRFVVGRLNLKPPGRFAFHTSAYFAAGLGFLVGVSAFVCLRWLDADSWWIVLTVFVVVQPYYSDATRRVSARVLGTLVGALVAVVLAYVLRGYPTAITALALVLTLMAAWANLKLPYWAFVTFLTPAVVLQSGGGVGDIVDKIVDRAMYTLIGAAAAILFLSVGHALIKWINPKHIRVPDSTGS